MNATALARPPAWLTIVGVVSLLWNLIGVCFYLGQVGVLGGPFLVDLADGGLALGIQGVPLVLVHDDEEDGGVCNIKGVGAVLADFAQLEGLVGLDGMHGTVHHALLQELVVLGHGFCHRSTAQRLDQLGRVARSPDLEAL